MSLSSSHWGERCSLCVAERPQPMSLKLNRTKSNMIGALLFLLAFVFSLSLLPPDLMDRIVLAKRWKTSFWNLFIKSDEQKNQPRQNPSHYH